MSLKHRVFPLLVPALVLFSACRETADPTGPEMVGPGANASVVPNQSQLEQWFEHASPVALAVGGAVFADNDEATGKLVFGVEHAAAARGVATALSRLGIPSSSVTIRITEPIHQVATLRDVFRPTVAGIQIHFGQYVCSIGFNADHANGRSMITASHCTNKQGGVEGTQYYQPLSSTDGTVIATEVADPVYTKNGPGCPRGRSCRRSDASRALYSSGVASNRGEIAQTTGVNNGSLNVSASNPVFTITAQGDVSSGTVNKVGRTTGWTAGTISGTCVTVNVSGGNITQICQTLVNSGQQIVAGGDSGSDVFKILSGSNVQLVGLLWGGNGSGTQFVYSPISNVVQELGALNAVK